MLSFKSLRQVLLMGVATFGTTAAVSAIAQPAFAQEVTRTYNIQAQDLNSALREFALQTGRDVLYPPEIVAGKRSNGVQGELTERQALEALLSGTGLRFEQTASTGYAVQDPNSPTQLGDARRVAPSDLFDIEEEIVVIGTNIRGVYPESSPVEIFTAEEIAQTGAATTEQFIQRLPQNQGTRTPFTGSATSQLNRESISSVDLRGLGVGTTLTLLNGRRMALANFGRAADISMIPLSAIERVEILTDGASAIYGSDAIGGVVNFVLRDDFEGAETRLTYGGVTSGGLRQGGFTQTFGNVWSSGTALFSVDLFSASPLENSDRSYAIAAGPGYLTPVDQRGSALLTLSQDIGENLEIHGDFVYAQREAKGFFTDLNNANPLNHSLGIQRSNTEQYFANIGLSYQISDDLDADMLLTYTNIDVDSLGFTSLFNRPLNSSSASDTNQTALDMTGMLSGTLLALPGGSVRFSVGGGYTAEEYTATRTAVGAISGRDLGRDTTYAFGELFIPLVGQGQGVPLVHRLELSIAARYTAYDDASEPALNREFGENTTPKIGVLWAPMASLTLRGTFGESFRAPALTEIDASAATNTLRSAFVIGGVPATAMFLFGPSPELEPETADSYTLGFDIRPEIWSDFRISGTYFNIDYQDRILAPSTVAARANPSAWPDLVYSPASAAEIEHFLRTSRNTFNNTGINLTDPVAASTAIFGSSNLLIVDERIRNLALSRLDGFDLTVQAGFDTPWGDINLGGQLTHIFDYQEQATSTAPVFDIVDTVLRPADLKGRLYVSLTQGRLANTLSVNYVDDYSNPLSTGSQEVESWTTLDWNLSYDAEEGEGAFGGLRLRLSVLNLLDEDPPRVSRNTDVGLFNPAAFDPANANPLGRFVTLSVTKTW